MIIPIIDTPLTSFPLTSPKIIPIIANNKIGTGGVLKKGVKTKMADMIAETTLILANVFLIF